MINPQFVIEEAERCWPNEACGVTFDGFAVALRNNSQNPTGTFSVSPGELAQAMRSHDGETWDGVWHSHPDGHTLPSDEDRSWHPPSKAMYIVAGGRVLEYDAEGTLLRVFSG